MGDRAGWAKLKPVLFPDGSALYLQQTELITGSSIVSHLKRLLEY